jgi:hypothetical protein
VTLTLRNRCQPKLHDKYGSFERIYVVQSALRGRIVKKKKDGVSSMDDALPDARIAFRAYLIRLHGPESGPTIRVLLVEASKARSIYEGFGSWPQCERWIGQLTGWITPRDVLADLHKRLEQKQLATINVVRTSVQDIESAGLSRVDS